MENGQDVSYIKEQLKNRPFNRRKLLQRTAVTAAMAIIFGLIACVTFLLLEPVFSDWLHPEEEVEMIEIPEDEEEMLPEDMLVHEETVLEQTEEVINSLKSEMEMDSLSYLSMYQDIYAMVQELAYAMVTVTGVVQDVDWLNDSYENRGQATGYLFADNNLEVLMLVMEAELALSEELQADFPNQDQAAAAVKGIDEETGLAVLAVKKSDLKPETLESLQYLSLGSSTGTRLLAQPVVALGRPLGKSSVVFGMITSTDTSLSLTDCNVKLLTTDIYGSTEATGLLLDMDAQVVGVINQNYNDAAMPNLISAIGITELKAELERMSNGLPHSYLGIQGTDVPEEIADSQGIPQGAYVTGIVMDSPAMAAGIQSGDIIIQMDEIAISSYAGFSSAIRQWRPGRIVNIRVMRQGQQDYLTVELEVTLGQLEP